jgi:hypothetical protein
MTLRKSIAVFALTAGLVGVTSEAKAQVTVSPGLGGVTVGGQSGAGLYIPYGGGAQFYHPSIGAWNYSNGTISPAYSSFYTPYGNNLYGTMTDSPYYNSFYTPSGNWGNPYGNYSSYYTPYSNWSGWSYPSTSYYYPSGYYYPMGGTTYYVNPGRGRGMFRR